MVSNWEGEGWMMGQGERSEFDQSEKIQYKLDSTVILIEDLGKANGQIIHNTLAVVSYNKKDNNFTFRSYLQNGRSGEFRLN